MKQARGEQQGHRFSYLCRAAGVALLLGCCVSAQAEVRFVDGRVSACGDGRSWATAYKYLQDALTAARNSGGTVTEIWVAAGTYQPDRSCANPAGSRNRGATFSLINGVALRGGFAGTEDPATFDLAKRDFDAHPTILSGDLAGNDAPGFVNYAENAWRVVAATSIITVSAVLDGFVISGGNATIDSGDARGGGLHNRYGSPVVTRCTFVANMAELAGGALSSRYGSSPSIIGCTFIHNRSPQGAAMYVDDKATLIDCTFVENAANINNASPCDGGGLYMSGSGNPQLTRCAFIGNSAKNKGGGVYSSGVSPTLNACTFSGNRSRYGAGMYSLGDGALTDCTFNENTADTNDDTWPCDGAGFYVSTGSPQLTRCAFIGNTAKNRGGGVYNSSGSPTLAGCTFKRNSVTGTALYNGMTVGRSWGGGLYGDTSSAVTLQACAFEANTSAGCGGGMEIYVGSATLINCRFHGNTAQLETGGGITAIAASLVLTNSTFTRNWAYDGGGLYTDAGSSSMLTNCTFTLNSGSNGCGLYSHGATSNAILKNCIVWDNNGSEIRGVATITHSCVMGINTGIGNIDADPKLVSAAAGDVRLGGGSPCIDAGNNADVPGGIITDIAGLARFFDDPAVVDCQWLPDTCGTAPIVDMGAHESNGLPPPTITLQPVASEVCPASSATFTVAGGGTGALSYQWRKDGQNLTEGGHCSGVTTPALTVSAADSGDQADYSCLITDANGATDSAEARLTIRLATIISQQPASQAATPATFTVSATGDGPLTYQWQKDGVNLLDDAHYTGTTTPSLNVSYCACGDTGAYRCVITGGCGPAVSEPATLACQPADFDGDTDVDLEDFARFQLCRGLTVYTNPECLGADLSVDGLIGPKDADRFLDCLSGPTIKANPNCGR